ncbi:MAG TPA: NifB/NifX family molybdenum-iron cluster-binding protein [bacterium]|nr:NifB/NifX family molybdenum-iron cluster-binding protein [bacterium]HPP87055.1 NifB/NifX family molybdenum-iron cluster-binding protein [bacterium]
MKLAISSLGDNIDSPIDPRFGRCQFLIFFDTETEKFKAEKNANIMTQGGAGIQTSQFVVDKNAEVVITGQLGPNAIKTLHAAGIKTFINASGTVKQAIADYKAGKLSELSNSTSTGHI